MKDAYKILVDNSIWEVQLETGVKGMIIRNRLRVRDVRVQTGLKHPGSRARDRLLRRQQ
jgi:hypothetical protein